MAPTTSPKIEELRFRLKTDPKNRLFYVLAEELRRISQFSEAEQVLRSGLTHHPTYLSAWVSLGRVQREQKNDAGAVESLSKALQLDPGNVVAARLLGDSYLSLGQKVEAIKKYKLVQALLPPDEQLEETVSNLERDLRAEAATPSTTATEPPVAVAEASPFTSDPASDADATTPSAETHAAAGEAPAAEAEPNVAAPADAGAEPSSPLDQPAEDQPVAPPETAPFFMAAEDTGDRRPSQQRPESEAMAPAPSSEASPWSDQPAAAAPPQSSPWSDEPAAAPPQSSPWSDEPAVAAPPAAAEASPWADEPSDTAMLRSIVEEQQRDLATGDSEPMALEHLSSPFEEPATGYTAGAFEVESPEGMHIARAPLSADVPMEPLVADELRPVDAPIASESASASSAAEADPFGEPTAAEHPGGAAAAAHPDDLTDTLTMADLYAKQGLVEDARHIYENILQREPDNDAVRAKLAALPGGHPPPSAPAAASAAKVARLEGWLARVARREVSHV